MKWPLSKDSTFCCFILAISVVVLSWVWIPLGLGYMTFVASAVLFLYLENTIKKEAKV